MRICVFLGSNVGNDTAYAEAATRVGSTLAEAGIGLVYGGGSRGLMGLVAAAVSRSGGEIMGVMPRTLLSREAVKSSNENLLIVSSMHERKAKMAELADAFLILPGGIGTMEEFFEVWTWRQLGYHDKPCGLLNVGGFFDPLLRFMESMVSQRFLTSQEMGLITVSSDASVLVGALQNQAQGSSDNTADILTLT